MARAFDRGSCGESGLGCRVREEDVHERRNVRVIPGFPDALVMPVVQLRSADEPFQRADGQADIRTDVDRPESAECEEAGEGLEREAEHRCGEIKRR